MRQKMRPTVNSRITPPTIAPIMIGEGPLLSSLGMSALICAASASSVADAGLWVIEVVFLATVWVMASALLSVLAVEDELGRAVVAGSSVK